MLKQLCKSCTTCFMFYCMFYFTCDRSFSEGDWYIFTDLLVRVAWIAYRIVKIEVDEDKLDTLAGPRSEGDVALDVGRVDRRIVRRRDRTVTERRRTDHIRVTFAMCWTMHTQQRHHNHYSQYGKHCSPTFDLMCLIHQYSLLVIFRLLRTIFCFLWLFINFYYRQTDRQTDR